MALLLREAKEWQSLKAKGKRHNISVKRVGPANVVFSGGIYAQLGTGRATTIMDARIKLKTKAQETGKRSRYLKRKTKRY